MPVLKPYLKLPKTKKLILSGYLTDMNESSPSVHFIFTLCMLMKHAWCGMFRNRHILDVCTVSNHDKLKAINYQYNFSFLLISLHSFVIYVGKS